jgi:hypothetical protein
MVTIPNFERYRQGDFIQYINNVLHILTNARASTFMLEPQHEALKAIIQKLNNAWQPKMGSELTPEIQELDNRRDLVFLGLKMTVDAWATNHYYAEWRHAANKVSESIARHSGRVAKMRYQQETATLSAIIKDLNVSLSNEVAELGLTGWVIELEMLNTAFNDKYVQRAQDLSGFEPGAIVALINEATKAFRKLKSMFEARFAVAEADGMEYITEFRQTANEWNSITHQYNDSVNRYAGNGGEPEAQPPGEPQPEA